MTVVLPVGAKVKRLPREVHLKAPCTEFERVVARKKSEVVVTTRATVKCVQVAAKDYPQHRALWQESGRYLDDELVLKVRK